MNVGHEMFRKCSQEFVDFLRPVVSQGINPITCRDKTIGTTFAALSSKMAFCQKMFGLTKEEADTIQQEVGFSDIETLFNKATAEKQGY